MREKYNCVLLVDDDYATNYIHKHVIKEANFAKHVKVAENGQEAIDYLSTPKEAEYIKPDVIFLDINMPIMDGWEFIEAYEALDEDLKSKMIVVLLSTSLIPDDKIKAKDNKCITQFLSKPLTVDLLHDLHY